MCVCVCTLCVPYVWGLKKPKDRGNPPKTPQYQESHAVTAAIKETQRSVKMVVLTIVHFVRQLS